MAERYGVLIPRNDIAKNWAKAVNFVPKKGEIIIYNADTAEDVGRGYYVENGNRVDTVTVNNRTVEITPSHNVRFKFGDGINNVNSLPFVTTGTNSDPSDDPTPDINPDDLSEFRVDTKTYTVTTADADSGAFPKEAFGIYYDSIDANSFLLFQDGVLLTSPDFYTYDGYDFWFGDGVLYEGSIITMLLFSGNVITRYINNGGGDEPGSVIVENIEAKTLTLSNTDKNEELEVRMLPKQFVYGTTALDESGNQTTNIASGIVYRISTDDAEAPGSADYGNKGYSLLADGKASLAVGTNNKSVTNYATTFGSHNINGSYGGFVSGTYNIALGEYYSYDDKISQYSTMVGRKGTAAADLSFVEGDSTVNAVKAHPNLTFSKVGYTGNSDNDLYEYWRGLTADKKFSIALGQFSHVGGLNSITGHAVSLAFGDECYTGGLCSVALGKQTAAKGSQSMAVNMKTKAIGTNSFAMGYETSANGENSFIGGGPAYNGLDDNGDKIIYYAKSDGKNSFSFGAGNQSLAEESTTFGWHNIANGKGSFLCGNSNESTEEATFAFASGGMNIVRGCYSSAFGSACGTYGENTFASGYESRAYNYCGHAMGVHAISYGEGQVVVGRYNTQIENNIASDENKAYFIVGVGKDLNNQKNGLIVFGDGRAEVASQGTSDNSVVIKKTLDEKLGNIEEALTRIIEIQNSLIGS